MFGLGLYYAGLDKEIKTEYNLSIFENFYNG